jgi:uncharacterized protein (TIGR03437 family)
MARRCANFLFALLAASCAFAQPVINSGSVLNSASYLSQGLPGSGIAQGSIFTIKGNGLGPGTMVQSGLPLPTSLAGTSVKVTVGTQSVDALILMTLSYQVNALLPSTTPTGSGSVTVTYNGKTSAPEPVRIVSTSFATYTFNSGGSGQAIATGLDYTVNTIIKTFHPGDWVILWGTGLGPINGDDSNKPPVGNIGGPTVHVGNASLSPYYAGRSAEYPGLDQVAFQIPSGIQGCYVPVAVETNGVVGGTATIAVSTSGQTCSDSILGQDLIDRLAAGGAVSFGLARLHATLLRSGGILMGPILSDHVSATFSEFTPPAAGLASYGVSQGYCLTTNNPDASPAQLDAGASIKVQGTSPLNSISTMTVPQLYGGNYFAAFVVSLGNPFDISYYQYAVSGAGGTKIGAFSVTDNTWFPSVVLSGIAPAQTIPVAGDLTVTWTGGSSMQDSQVSIGGVSWTTASQNIGGYFICTAPLSAQSFTIPKWVLSTLPPSGTGSILSSTFPLGLLWIGQPNKPVNFQATGLDKGILVQEYVNGYPVSFQ